MRGGTDPGGMATAWISPTIARTFLATTTGASITTCEPDWASRWCACSRQRTRRRSGSLWTGQVRWRFDAKMAVAKAVAGAVAFAALAGGDRVVPYATPGPQGRLLSRAPAGSHLASWPVIESWLESLEPSGEIPDGSVLRRLVLESGVSGPIILVSDLMVPGWKDLISGVGVATGGLILHVLGPSELDPSLAGDLRLVDSETNDEVDFSTSRAAIAAYADRFDRFVSDVATHSRRVGMEYVTVVAGPHALGDSIAAMARLGVLA